MKREMKRFMGTIIALLLCISMVIPSNAMQLMETADAREEVIIDFENVKESVLNTTLGVIETNYSAPTLSLTDDNTENGNGAQIAWTYDGTKSVYEHHFSNGLWSESLLNNADNYEYFRIWVVNPSHTYFDMALGFSSDVTTNYYDMNQAKLIRQDGLELEKETCETGEMGSACSLRIPKQFSGWVTFPLDISNLKVATGHTSRFTNFSDIETAFILNRRVEVKENTEDVYILDNFVLSDAITGTVKSLEDDTDYGKFDTTQKGTCSIDNIIFMIGDGMGDGALDTARLEREVLHLDELGSTGYVGTNNVLGEITDSAAAGTALAAGVKTGNKIVGLGNDYTPVMNLSEYMKQFGKKVGVVTTSYLADATPAAFAAHTSARGNYGTIAQDMLELGVDILMGGGKENFSGTIKDNNDNLVPIYEYAQTEYNYEYITTEDEMNTVTSDKVLGLFANSAMTYMLDKSDTSKEPTLAEMTQATLEWLDNDNGFFVMIEGGRIDHAGHANDGERLREETLAFDDAVEVAMDYVDNNENTLLVITADHETGGVAVTSDGVITFSSTGHTAAEVPYYVYGEGIEYFNDLTDNIQLNAAIKRATVADTSSDASSVAEVKELVDTDVVNVVNNGSTVEYEAKETLGSLYFTDASAKYAVLKYRTDVEGLVGSIDGNRVQYVGDGLWHISHVIDLARGSEHTFNPFSYIRDKNSQITDIVGSKMELAYVAFFDCYESATAFQAKALLEDEYPEAPMDDDLTVMGASTRFVDTEGMKVDGIRFKVGVKAEAFKLMTDEQKANYRLLIMPTALVDGRLEKGETYTYTVGSDTQHAYAQDVRINWKNAKEENGYMVAHIYLYNINYNYYTIGITARAYYEDEIVEYSNSLERSYYYVANAALNDLSDAENKVYANPVGSKYSRYNAVQRDALLGVSYVKTGTWDYIDGNLVQTSSASTDSLVDRTVRTGDSEYVLYTSFKTGTLEEAGTNLHGGFQFGYDSKTGTFLEVGYRNNGSALVACVVGYDGQNDKWVVDIPIEVTLDEEQWYDFCIAVEERDDDMKLWISYRKSGTSEFTIIVKAQTIEYTYAEEEQVYTVAYGNETRMYVGRETTGHMFASDLRYDEDYYIIQDDGRIISKLENGLQISGTSNSTSQTKITDLNNKVKDNGTNNANFVLSVDMVWEDKQTDDYQKTGFQIGGYNMQGSGKKYEMYFSPKGLRTSSGNKYALKDLAANIDGIKVVQSKIAAGIPVTWTIEAKTAGDVTTFNYYVEDVLFVTETCSNTVIFSNRIMYAANANVTFTNYTLLDKAPTSNYVLVKMTGGTADITEIDSGVMLEQTGLGEVNIKDLIHQLPNTTNFVVEVDMSPVTMVQGFKNTQGLNLGGRQIVIGNGKVGIYDGKWYTCEYSSDIADKLTQNSFTFIVTMNVNVITIGVRVNGIESQLQAHKLKNPLKDTTIMYYSGRDSATMNSTIKRTFTNLKFANVPELGFGWEDSWSDALENLK